MGRARRSSWHSVIVPNRRDLRYYASDETLRAGRLTSRPRTSEPIPCPWLGFEGHRLLGRLERIWPLVLGFDSASVAFVERSIAACPQHPVPIPHSVLRRAGDARVAGRLDSSLFCGSQRRRSRIPQKSGLAGAPDPPLDRAKWLRLFVDRRSPAATHPV